MPTVSQQRTLLLLYSNTALTFHLTSANSLPTTHAPLALQQHGPNFASYKCQQSPNNARSSHSTANTALTFHLTSANSLPTTHAPLALQQHGPNSSSYKCQQSPNNARKHGRNFSLALPTMQHGPNFSSYKCQQSPNNARSSCSTATRP